MILLGSTTPFCLGQLSQPVITDIRSRGSNVVVNVSVPAGICRVTLESRTRLGAGTWAPAAVSQTDGGQVTLTFSIPRGQRTELLRVRADAVQPLPASFYGGTNLFTGPPTNLVTGLVDSRTGGVVGDLTAGNTTPGASGREVVESDIWKLDGDRLYFFNQYRGLQVIDITQPDASVIVGTLSLPAAGEQMYLVGSNHVVLLARNGCGYGVDASQAVVVGVTNGQPQVVTNLTLPGYLLESRMVGSALYVASQMYRPLLDKTNTVWEWGTQVSSFDLADPAAPVSRGTLWFGGYGNVVTATDKCLFVVTQDPTNWWQSVVRVIDVTAPDGTMADYASINTAGRVNDKFKLNYSDGVFTSISEDWHWNGGRTLVTKLETFRLPEPSSAGPGEVSRLGQLELGNGEQLHATRFDGNLAYIVTFFRIDPLWVVDLSDPANPHIAGELQVPGWSTYILPLGPRLVAVGVESNRVAVSLFDVKDPANPGLLSRVLLGQNYSWSEANSDEKAFTALPGNGLILVPYNGDTTNGWTTRVQLIDLTPTSLVARGIIQHQCQPRRATFSHNRILSLSGWELLSVDATDRDQPVVRGQTALAWPVDRLFVTGDFLLQLSTSAGWGAGGNPPTVRVTPADRPDLVLKELTLKGLPIVGAALKDDRLFLAQSRSLSYPLPPGGEDTNGPNFFLTVVDAANLPDLRVSGQVAVTADLPGWSGSWTAVWPKAREIVWVGGGMDYRGYWWAGPLGGPLDRGGFWMPWPSWQSGGGRLLAFDVSDATAPTFNSEVNFATNDWWGFSQPFTSGTLVYLSHSTSGFLPSPDTNSPGTWIQRDYLDVVDYADPVAPTVRKPSNIPGTLRGLSHSGELLYTVGIHWSTSQVPDWREWLDASAYDGVATHEVASMPLPDAWPHPLIVVGTNIFLGRPGYNNTDTNIVDHQVERWALPDTGRFELFGKARMDAPASALVERLGLLAVQRTDLILDLFDYSPPGGPLQIGEQSAPGCLWFDLNQAEGDLKSGLWIPLWDYGVFHVPVGW